MNLSSFVIGFRKADFWSLAPENTMILQLKPCSFPLQNYAYYLHVNGDVKLVHETYR